MPAPTLQASVEITPSALPDSVPTLVSVSVPKQRDLIFIEFFAVT
jgi:hypothetical protein